MISKLQSAHVCQALHQVGSYTVDRKYEWRMSWAFLCNGASILRPACKEVRCAHRRPSILQGRLPFTLLEVATGQKLGEFSHFCLRDRGPVLIASLRLDILRQLGGKRAEVVQSLLLSAASPHELELGVDNIWWSLGVSMIVRVSSLYTHTQTRDRENRNVFTLSGLSSEEKVFSANAIRSDLRHKLANLIHMTGSSSGCDTSVLT